MSTSDVAASGSYVEFAGVSHGVTSGSANGSLSNAFEGGVDGRFLW